MITQFLEHCELNARYATRVLEVYQAYLEFCRERGLTPEVRRVQEMPRKLLESCSFLARHRTNRGVLILGLKLETAPGRENKFYQYQRF